MTRPEPVAIVGMAAVYPGAADLGTYWRNIVSGVDSISRVPAHRWDPVFFDADDQSVDRVRCRRGGFIDDVATVDPVAAGVVPASCDLVEPDQLLSLGLATDALTDAQIDVERLRERTAVIVGRGGYITPGMARHDQRVRTAEQLAVALRSLIPDLDEKKLQEVKSAFVEQLGPDRPDAAIDLVPNFAASRISNRLDLGGPAYTVDAACASSLIAVDHAVRELSSGRCDLAIAGGVHVCHDITFWTVFTQLGALSSSETIRPFDRRADGLLMGEGGGMVALQRLSDAVRNQSRIYAVIHGVGVSSDGRGASLMRPSVEGQLLAVQRAWEQCELDPGSLGLLEAHGTATPVGDTAELETLRRFFGGPEDRRAVIGSVKSMIGHSMPAAGAAGLIKAAMAVHEGILPPTLHCEEPTEALAPTRFEPVAQAREWEGAAARVAAVNAFGFGGINAHVVLGEHPGSRNGASRAPRPSAGRAAATGVTETVLMLAGTDAADLLRQLDAQPPAQNVGDVRPPAGGPARLVLIDPTTERVALARKILDKGRPWRGRQDLWFEPSGLPEGAKTAFLFPGVEGNFEPRAEDVAEHFGLPVPPRVRPDAAAHDLEGLGRSMIALARVLDAAARSLGLRPDVIAGQSIGEWSGMISAGMIPTDEIDPFIRSVQIGSLRVPGLIYLAVGGLVGSVEALLGDIPGAAISHDNCPHQTIVCTSDEFVEELERRCRAAKLLFQRLPFQSGFHTPMFAPFVPPFRAAMERVPLQHAEVPLWSATTCAPYPDDPAAITELSTAHLVSRVRFRELTSALYDDGVRLFIQIGAGTLNAAVEDTLRDCQDAVAVTTNSPRRTGMEQLLRALCASWSAGVDGLRFDRLVHPPCLENSPEPAVKAKSASRRPITLATPLVRLPESLSIRLEAAGAGPATGHETDGRRAAPADALSAELEALFAESRASAELVSQALSSAATQPAVAPRASAPAAGGPAAAAPQTTESRRRLAISVQDFPEFVDHCLFYQPPDWPDLVDSFPVVPMTAMVELMQKEAQAMVPGHVVVGVERIRALQWLPVEPPTEVGIRARRVPSDDGQTRVEVTIENYAGATVVLSKSYAPADGVPTAEPMAAEQPSPGTGEEIYARRMLFHGPAYQGLGTLSNISDDGIDGTLVATDAVGGLLDAAGQLMGIWVTLRNDEDRFCFPVSIGRMRFFQDAPPVGASVEAQVRFRPAQDPAVIADLWVYHQGRLWAHIEGWEDRRFFSDETIYQSSLYPESTTISSLSPHGFELVHEVWDAAAGDLMMRRYLSAGEKEEYQRRNLRARKSYLLGRIAAKDAVRRVIWEDGHRPIWPVEVVIGNDDHGRPVLLSPAGTDIRVSIAHKGKTAVAMAVRDGDPGIDIEEIGERTEHFATSAFSESELDLLLAGERRAARDAWLTIGWAAKEAVAKSGGMGLQGRPRDFVITEVEKDRVRIDGHWVGIESVGDTVLAWTIRRTEDQQ